jgi:hypothetical protein
MNIMRRLVGVGALAVIFSAGAYADTLELKDGRVLQGKYLGGTQVIIRFEIQGDVQTFRVREISAVSFEGGRRNDRDRRDDGAPPPEQSGPSQPPPPPQSSNGQYDPPPQDQRDQRPYDQQGNNPPPNDQSQQGNYPPPNDQSQQGNYPPPNDQSQQGNYPPPPADSRDRYDRDQDRQRQDPRDQDQGRDQDRDRDSGRQTVYAAPGTSFTIPNGQRILVRMIDGVDSRHNVVGDGFHASLENDIVVDNILVARRGSDIYGRLSYTKESGRLAGSAELQLELTRLVIDGQEFPVTTGEYTVRGRGRGEDTARKVGTGAVAGAIIGAIAGGGQGAAIGAGVGSAAGAGVQLATRGREVRVPSETLLEFRLDEAATVTPTQR